MAKGRITGSEVFGTTAIKTDEYVLMAKVMRDAGSSTEQIALEIEALDDMLCMQRLRSVTKVSTYTPSGKVRKDWHFSNMLNNRVDKLVEDLKQITP